MHRATFDFLLSLIGEDDPPRVWSLLVTIFGDLAQEPGSTLRGQLLSCICDLIGIRLETMRVALHRLKKDNWITGERVGRSTDYFLTEWGRAQCAKATPIIYSTHEPPIEVWLVHTDPGKLDEVRIFEGFGVTSTLFLSTQPVESSEVFQTKLGHGDKLPDWITGRVCDERTAAQSKALSLRLEKLMAALALERDLSPVEVAVLRVLIVHSWRRLVLKVPELPDHVFPANWSGAMCRTLVGDCLNLLPKPSHGSLLQDASDRQTSVTNVAE